MGDALLCGKERKLEQPPTAEAGLIPLGTLAYRPQPSPVSIDKQHDGARRGHGRAPHALTRCGVRLGLLGDMTYMDSTLPSSEGHPKYQYNPCAGGKAPLAAGAGERQVLHRARECALACAADPASTPPRLLAAAVLFLGCAADGEQLLQGFLLGSRVSWQHRCAGLPGSL